MVKRRTPISDMKVEKGKLLNVFHDLNFQSSNYPLNIIPELLWLDILLNTYSIYEIADELMEFLWICKKLIPEWERFFGNISDFDKIIDKVGFVRNNKDIIDKLVIEPFWDIVLMYGDVNPMYYMIELCDYHNNEINKDKLLNSISISLEKLQDGKSNYSIERRLCQFRFAFLTKQIGIRVPDIVELLEKYPGKLTLDEIRRCNQFIYLTMNTSSFAIDKIISTRSNSFWEKNLILSSCY